MHENESDYKTTHTWSFIYPKFITVECLIHNNFHALKYTRYTIQSLNTYWGRGTLYNHYTSHYYRVKYSKKY